jgi:hypothetical protein
MAVSKKQEAEILRLVNEGKTCSAIQEEDFPNLDYWEIMGVIYGVGKKTALGTKRAIANRCKRLRSREMRDDDRRRTAAREINDLAWGLYAIITENQKRFKAIRDAIR